MGQDVNTYTIILKTSERISHTRMEIFYDFEIIQIDQDGWKRSIPFEDIDKILDFYYEDVTYRFLGNRHILKKGESWPPEEDLNSRLIRTRPWQYILGADANYSLPLGDYYEGIDPGIGFAGNMAVALSDQLGIRFRVSRSGMNDGDELQFYSLDPDIVIVEQDVGFTVIHYIASVFYYGRLDKKNKDTRSYGYLSFGLGGMSTRISFDMLLEQQSTGATQRYKDSTTETDFLMSWEIGILKEFSDDFGINLSCCLNSAIVETIETNYGSDAQYAYDIDIRAGIIKFF
jgi:hypothetical protein